MLVLMQDFVDNVAAQPLLAGVGVLALLLLAWVIYRAVQEWRLMGTLSLMSRGWMVLGIAALVITAFTGYRLTREYETPAAGSLAIVVGNTANTPRVQLNEDMQHQISQMMMRHQGEEPEDFIDNISVVEADGAPWVVDLNPDKLKSISENATQAKINIDNNIKEIERQLAEVKPRSSGANYLEAILTANDELSGDDEYARRGNIMVIGSGLSDTGDLNFVSSGVLTNESIEDEVINKAIEDQEDALKGATIKFYGLGDTNAPQAALTNTQRKAVRDIYTKLARKLGAKVDKRAASAKSLSGQSVDTKYTVNPVDTGCGNVDLTFDDSKLKFDSDKTNFADQDAAAASLGQVVTIYQQNKDAIKQIAIDGYTAHYPSKHENLAGDRANTVRDYLISKGIPADIMVASGKGYGPFEYSDKESHDDTDSRNRMIKISIERNAQECRK